jgi:hypothetical protein
MRPARNTQQTPRAFGRLLEFSSCRNIHRYLDGEGDSPATALLRSRREWGAEYDGDAAVAPAPAAEGWAASLPDQRRPAGSQIRAEQSLSDFEGMQYSNSGTVEESRPFLSMSIPTEIQFRENSLSTLSCASCAVVP